MASPANPSIQIRYSFGDLIREPADLDRVNEKLLNSGYSYTRIGCVKIANPLTVVPTIKHPGPSGADVLHVDEAVSDTRKTLSQMVASSTLSGSTLPESLNLTSPDSNLPCESPDCPIKGIPHNIGRYFHDGEQYKSPSAPGFASTLAGIMEEVSNAFNRTVPTPEIVTAYINIKTFMDKATKTDLHMVREYQKHHMWRPVDSEPSTPWPRDQYPRMHGLHGQMPPGNEMYLAADGITSIFEQKLPVWSVHAGDNPIQYRGLGSFSFEQEGERPLLASDFENSDDEDYVPFPPIRAAVSDGSSTRPLLSPVTAWIEDESNDSDDEVSDIQHTLYRSKNASLGTMREIPQGRELVSEKLRLQEKILRQIANDALVQSKKGGGFSGQQGINEIRRPCYANRDRDLEVLLGLMEALPQDLDVRGFRSILQDEKRDFSGAEFRVLKHVQMILQREFQALITNARQTYVQTGLPVTTAQLREKLNDIVVGRKVVLEANPGQSVGGIVRCLFQGDADSSAR